VTPQPAGRRTLVLAVLGGMIGAAPAAVLIAVWGAIGDGEAAPLVYDSAVALVAVGILVGVLVARTRAEAPTRRAIDSQMDAVIRSTREAFVSMDQEGRITAWNPEAEQTFGWPAPEAIGRTVADTIVPPEHREAHRDGLDRFLRTGEGPVLARRLELDAQHRDGHRFPVSLTISSVETTDGWSFHSFLHDISDRKRSERELRDRATDLDVVAEATRELARSTESGLARTAICGGAREVSGAAVSMLFEPDPTGVGLRVTTALGAEVEGVLLPFVGEPAAAVRAFTSGEPFFLSNVVGHPAVSQGIVHQTGAVSVFWQPVVRGGTVIGVLTVAWRERVDEPAKRLVSAMNLLAAEAAVAIDRADLLLRLGSMARTDDLTGLPNRRAWEEELPRELARARRGQHPVSVAMLDLDRFKEFNDRHGHQAGDRLLKEAAGAWREVLRETDTLARYGGEEFSVILADCGSADASRLVERLRDTTPEGESCSAGIAEWDQDETPESLVGRADAALYEAKRTGRNRSVSSPSVRIGD
jgi:diguanylate cyclase (GGDEF)-like protein/PAS domain S-box-containing protein